MNIISIIIIFLISFLLLLVLSFVFISISILFVLKKKNDLDIANIELNMIPNKEDFNIIDSMINEEINKYHIIKNEPNNIEYMSDESIKDMEKYVLSKVLNNMSPLNLQRLKYIYNPDKLEDIIYEKVQLAVISYSSELNSTTTKYDHNFNKK